MNINNKGFTLIEVVIVIAILGIISSVIYGVFQFGIDSYHSGSNQQYQQDKIVDIVQIIRRQVEEAVFVKYEPTSKLLMISNKYLSDADKTSYSDVMCWKFDDNKLKFSNSGNVGYEDMIWDIDTNNSTFNVRSDKLTVKIKPIELNQKYKNRNITEPRIFEMSVRYKITN